MLLCKVCKNGLFFVLRAKKIHRDDRLKIFKLFWFVLRFMLQMRQFFFVCFISLFCRIHKSNEANSVLTIQFFSGECLQLKKSLHNYLHSFRKRKIGQSWLSEGFYETKKCILTRIEKQNRDLLYFKLVFGAQRCWFCFKCSQRYLFWFREKEAQVHLLKWEPKRTFSFFCWVFRWTFVLNEYSYGPDELLRRMDFFQSIFSEPKEHLIWTNNFIWNSSIPATAWSNRNCFAKHGP